MLEQGEEELLAFVRTVYEKNASALIVNAGRFVDRIPSAVVDFCSAHHFPLFSIPWSVPLVDVTRDWCQQIMDDQVLEKNIITVFKNLIFRIGNTEDCLRQMERFGYLSSSAAQWICISLDIERGTQPFWRKNLTVM